MTAAPDSPLRAKKRKQLALPRDLDLSSLVLTADWHLSHPNILRYCPNRKSATIEEMEESLVTRYNEIVGPGDVVIFAGDFFWKGCRGDAAASERVRFRLERMRRCLERLRGRKYLVRGNHDTFREDEYLSAGFLGFGDVAVLQADGDTFTVLHSPRNVVAPYVKRAGCAGDRYTGRPEDYGALRDVIAEIPGRYVCGHVHRLWRRIGPFVNVGVDVWDGRPVRFCEIPPLFSGETQARPHLPASMGDI